MGTHTQNGASVVAGQTHARQSASGPPHEGSQCANLPLSKSTTHLMHSSHSCIPLCALCRSPVLSRWKPSTIHQCASLPALDLDHTDLSSDPPPLLCAPSLSHSISSAGRGLLAPNQGRRSFLPVCCGFRDVFSTFIA